MLKRYERKIWGYIGVFELVWLITVTESKKLGKDFLRRWGLKFPEESFFRNPPKPFQ
jgi:hypothetical protein